MNDPLSEVIGLLRPKAVFTKGISGAGRWGIRYSDFGHPSFAIVIEGSAILAVDGQKELILNEGDFRALPTTPVSSSLGSSLSPPDFSILTKRHRPPGRFATADRKGHQTFVFLAALRLRE